MMDTIATTGIMAPTSESCPAPEGKTIMASLLRLEYDQWRGGFCLHFGQFDRARSSKLFGGIMAAYTILPCE